MTCRTRALLARRRARVEALLLARPGARGGTRSAAPGRLAGRRRQGAGRSTSRSGARRHPRHRRPAGCAGARPRSRPRSPRRAARGRRCPQRRRRVYRPRSPACGASGRDRDLRRRSSSGRSSTRAPRTRASSSWWTSGSTCRPASVEALQTQRRADPPPRAARESDKYRRGVVGVAAGSAQHGAAGSASAAAPAGRGRVSTSRRDTGRPGAAARGWPRWSSGRAGCRPWPSGPVPVTGPDGWTGAGRRRPRRGCRRARGLGGQSGGLRPLVPAAAAARLPVWPGWSVPRDDVEARRLHRHGRRRRSSVVVLLKGSTTSLAGTGGSRVNLTGTCLRLADGWLRRRPGRPVRRAAAGGLGPFDAGSGRRLAARAGRPAGLGRRGRWPPLALRKRVPAGPGTDLTLRLADWAGEDTTHDLLARRRRDPGQRRGVAGGDLGRGPGGCQGRRLRPRRGPAAVAVRLAGHRAAGTKPSRCALPDQRLVGAWLIGPGEAWAEALAADVDVSVNAGWALDEVVATAPEDLRLAHDGRVPGRVGIGEVRPQSDDPHDALGLRLASCLDQVRPVGERARRRGPARCRP